MTAFIHPRKAPMQQQHPLITQAWQLVNSPFNIFLTAVVSLLLFIIIPPVFNWVFWSATFTGDNPKLCQADGACWIFIKIWYKQFLYGFYPEAERWRVNLSAILLLLHLIFLFMPLPQTKRFKKIKSLLKLSLFTFFPVTSWCLFYGGILGLTAVPSEFWGGLHLTLVVAFIGIALSLPIGIFLALCRRSELFILKWLATLFIEVIRGVPLISVLFMASVMVPLFLPDWLVLDKVLRALLGMTLFFSAYMAEVIRGGLQAIPLGQTEAAKSLGMGYSTRMRFIILPQALNIVIPGIVNTFIALFKDTTLILIIGLYDFLGIIQAANTDPEWVKYITEGYLFAAAVFWLFCFGISRYSQHLERKRSYVY